MVRTLRKQFDKYLTYDNLMKAHKLSRKGKELVIIINYIEKVGKNRREVYQRNEQKEAYEKKYNIKNNNCTNSSKYSNWYICIKQNTKNW